MTYDKNRYKGDVKPEETYKDELVDGLKFKTGINKIRMLRAAQSAKKLLETIVNDHDLWKRKNK